METGTEDPNTSVAARFAAAKKVHRTWLGQRMRVRKLSQSPSSSRSRVDQGEPPRACIQYERSLADILFVNDYDEDDFLASGITLFNVYQKLLQLQELCATCGQTPSDELNQETLLAL